MKTIKQRDEWDCGVACLAMLAGRDYDEALRFMLSEYPQVEKSRKVSSGKIVSGLRSFGIEPARGRCTSMDGLAIDELSGDALVGVRPDTNADNANHWVVWDKRDNKARDPYGYPKVFPVKYLLVRAI